MTASEKIRLKEQQEANRPWWEKFYDKYIAPSEAVPTIETYDDPLKRNMSYAERLAQGVRGASR